MIKFVKGKDIKSYRSYLRWYMKIGRWGKYEFSGFNEEGLAVFTRLN